MVLLSLPGLLHAAAILGMGWGQGSDSATLIAGVGEAALIAAGVGAPFLLPPRPRRERHWRLPLVVATSLTALFVVGLSTRFDLVQASALYGLRMELPPLGSIAGVAYVMALFGWSYATVELIADKGGMRLCGYGLGLLALGGYDAGSPVELTLSLAGAAWPLSVGELRAAPYADRESAARHLRRLARLRRPPGDGAGRRERAGRDAARGRDRRGRRAGGEPDPDPPPRLPAGRQAVAPARHAGRAGRLGRASRSRAARRQHRTSPSLAGAQPRASPEARRA